MVNFKETLETYSRVAYEFDRTRHYQWKTVKQYVNDLKSNTYNLDLGCGNGRNTHRADCTFVSTDIVEEMCKICKSKDKEVIRHCATQLPFKNEIFDNIVCIAVLHHIKIEEQAKVLNEIKRVMKTGGTAIIQVWATGGNRSLGYNYIEWKGIKKSGKRLYYIFSQSELESLVNSVGLQIICLYYEHENWGVIVKKQY